MEGVESLLRRLLLAGMPVEEGGLAGDDPDAVGTLAEAWGNQHFTASALARPCALVLCTWIYAHPLHRLRYLPSFAKLKCKRCIAWQSHPQLSRKAS